MVVRSIGSNVSFANPGNVVVGMSSDLILEVECMSENGTGTETFTWEYRNGTVLPTGLQAFGVSQGDGILRVHPVQLLSEGSEFTCTSDGSSLNVTFNLGRCATGRVEGLVGVVMGGAMVRAGGCEVALCIDLWASVD